MFVCHWSSGQVSGHKRSKIPITANFAPHNSNFIKDRLMMFAYIMGFSAVMDRMVWSPSLSFDQK